MTYLRKFTLPQVGKITLSLTNGRGGQSEEAKRIERLEKELAERDQVIGEITIANRILKKLSGGLS